MINIGYKSFICMLIILLTSIAISIVKTCSFQILVNGIFSIMAFLFTLKVIPNLREKFISARVIGVDQAKVSSNPIPESMGVVAGSVFLVIMFLFIPIPFISVAYSNLDLDILGKSLNMHIPVITLSEKIFNSNEFTAIITSLLCICCMLLLGFVDDTLDLKWLYKLILPTIATLPLLIFYSITYDLTSVLLPKPFSFVIKLGPLYYVYMGMLAVFCTNAINILAGINGLEAGQSLVISFSILIFNLIEMSGDQRKVHLFSFEFMLPFSAVCASLLYHNWFPASVFVGDTFCYFAGMTFAVVGILGHFSKTMILFFIPQVFNFLFSLPQLLKFLPCPRHRLPKFNKETGLLENSVFQFDKSSIDKFGKLMLNFAKKFHLVKETKISKGLYSCSNFTLINLMIVLFGPIKEEKLTIYIITLQIISSCFAFLIRYYLVQYIY